MRYLSLVLFVAMVCRAAPGEGSKRIIKDDELIPHLKEYHKLIQEAQKGRLKVGDLIQRYAQQKLERNISKRERALRTFMYGSVVQNLSRDFTAARREFEACVKIWPDFPAAYIALASVAARADDTRATKRYLRKALAVDPTYVDALIHLGRLAREEEDLDEAERLFKEALDVKPTPQAFMGLQDVYTARWRDSVTEENKVKWSRRAVLASKLHVEIEPKSGLAHLFRAKAYKDLGDLEQAIAKLEDSYANYGLEEKWRLEILMRLIDFYQRKADVDAVRRTIERLLKIESLNAAQRDRLEQMLVDIKDKGKESFVIWTIDGLLAILRNDQLNVRARVRALEQLLAILEQPDIMRLEKLRPKAREIFASVFRVLVDAPPRVAQTTLRWMRMNIKDPHLTRILVHFIYPYDDDKRSPEVRVAAVRALDVSCGEASLPALFYCLADADGRVVREVDKALSRLCETRSVVGGGIEPLNEKQRKTAYKQWNRFATSDEGAECLAKAYVKLAELVQGDESRGQQSAPMVDHAVTVVLLNNDMPWVAWKAAYEFLLKYWGKDFRPPEARGRPVQPSDRVGIVKELQPFWDGSKRDTPEPEAPKEKDD